MPGDLDDFWVHTVTVHPYLGQSETDGSDLEGPPVTVAGFLDDTARLVRTADGSEVLSTATFYTDLASAERFPLDSRVALPRRTARVVSVNGNDSGALGLPDHAAVSLT